MILQVCLTLQTDFTNVMLSEKIIKYVLYDPIYIMYQMVKPAQGWLHMEGVELVLER